MDNEQPIEKFRAGQVTCALFANEITVEGKQHRILKAAIGRRYKDRNGNWKTSQSFSRNEIPLAVYVLQKAFEYMIEKKPESEEVEQQAVV